ncbi:MAG: formylglycine-generating enzyme family protein [Pseudomonadota bacterium]
MTLRLAAAVLLAARMGGAAAVVDSAAAPAAPQRAATACVAPPPAKLLGGERRRDCADTPELVSIAAGRFEMGDVLGNGPPYEKPVHPVRIEAFLIGRYEVTVGEWRACVAAGACPESRVSDADLRQPVSLVSWDDAQRYLAWLSRRTGRPYRLPSEAEWEYAARAGTDTQYSWGNHEIAGCLNANTLDLRGGEANPSWTWAADCDDGHAGPAPVGSYPANAWGLHDMLGNVWEWVADCWHSSYEGAPDNGRAWVQERCSKRVNRGGGWGNHVRTTRVSTRDGDIHGGRSDGLGFRVARDIIYAKPAVKPAGPQS